MKKLNKQKKPLPYVNHLQILLRELTRDAKLVLLEKNGKYSHFLTFSNINESLDIEESEDIIIDREFIQLKAHKNYEPFWYKVELELDNLVFKQCKIKVFTGDDYKELLFSADWMNNRLKHGQPHWHFEYPLIEETTKINMDDNIHVFNGPQEFDVNQYNRKGFISTREKIKEFHFAMNAELNHNSILYSRNIESPMQLLNWVKHTIIYIKEQLEWIIG